ncbi:oligosaccharide flippase family protein [Haloechinothrix sp. LS1_15]|uniref:oligosaccharide flippase family protein n=1 Tax=Haloechinothrix sp. LS1_15 TaxID=2652248 RepID=UPI00294661BE|nr:oligosaccharide flippase family protein [Haloechinothrix sp. LS1_15]MDV6013342.1 oligosaccharide flippase family protein [Haloechinothrix sp. LS1_15]
MAGGPSLTWLRRITSKLAAPVVAQALTAGTSLLLQVIAAHALGLAEFGAFSLFLALLVSAVALYTGYVGDSLAVLERHEPRIRSALVTSALSAMLLCAAVAIGAALVVRAGDGSLAALYAVMVVAWLLKESARRLLIARLEFGKLVALDTVYLVVTLTTLVAFHLWGPGISLHALFLAMAAGALACLVSGLLWLPRYEWRRLRPGFGGMRELASFAAWRSAQATLRPAALLGARVLVANLLSLTAVGMLEAARLVVAPLQVMINGAGSYLLAGFSVAEREGAARSGALTGRALRLLLPATVGIGVVLALLADPLGRLLTGEPVDRWIVFGWVAYLAVWAAGLPYITEVVARRRSRAVFAARLADSLAGLLLAGALLLAGLGVAAVPWAMALGGCYAVWRARRLALATRQHEPV